MKKIVCILLAVVIMLPVFSTSASEDDVIKVVINGASHIFDVSPIIRNNRVLVPMRAIFEALGCTVEYVEESDAKSVYAHKGSNMIHLDIGGSEMEINYDKVVSLDSPAIIYNNRTLVPIRAVSEALKADVSWDGDTKTVIIKEYGDHKITNVILEKEFSDNNTVLINTSYEYPMIENKDSDPFIDSINEKFKADAEKFADEIKAEWFEAAQAEYEYKTEEGYDFYPYETSVNYDVECDKNGKLCIVLNGYYYTGGAHPFSSKESFVYDLENKKELTLSDILKADGEEKQRIVCDSFEQFIKTVAEYAELDTEDDIFVEMREEIKNEADNVKFYITDDALILYFDVYQVAAYVFGYPTAELYFEGNRELFK